MALNFAEKTVTKKKEVSRVEDGAYPARIVQVIDFGKQIETDYKTGEPKVYEDSGQPVIKHKVWINFELPTETIELDGEQRPRWYGKEYTVSGHEKSALFALLKAIDPKGEHASHGRNVRGILGLPLMVTIGSTSSGKAKVAGVSAVPKGMHVEALANGETFFDLDGDDIDVFESLPKWMQDRIIDGIDFDKTNFYQVINTKDVASKVSVAAY